MVVIFIWQYQLICSTRRGQHREVAYRLALVEQQRCLSNGFSYLNIFMNMVSAENVIMLLLCCRCLVLGQFSLKSTRPEMLVAGGNLRRKQMSPLTMSPASI